MAFHRTLRYLPAFLCMTAIFWLSSQPGNEVAQAAKPLYDTVPKIGKTITIPWLKVGHIVCYSALGAALLYAFRPVSWKAVFYALSVTGIYAITDEFHQTFVPGRHAGTVDVIIDVCAAGVVILLIILVKQILITLRQWAGRDWAQ
jgi:VanZ family protein